VVAVHAGASTELFIVQCARGEGSSPGRVKGSSRAMLATARPSCHYLQSFRTIKSQLTPTDPSDAVVSNHPTRCTHKRMQSVINRWRLSVDCPMGTRTLRKRWINVEIWRRNFLEKPFSLKVYTTLKPRRWNDVAYSTWIQRCGYTLYSTLIRLANAQPLFHAFLYLRSGFMCNSLHATHCNFCVIIAGFPTVGIPAIIVQKCSALHAINCTWNHFLNKGKCGI